MPMEIHRKALKERARQVMRQNIPAAWLVALVFWGLTTGVSTAASLVGVTTQALSSPYEVQFFPLFFSLLLTMYSLVMDFGYQIWCLRAWRRERADFGNLIDGFGMAGRVLIMEIHIFLRLFAWCLLPIVPATILIAGVNSVDAMVFLIWLLSAAMVPYIYLIRLRYALASYLLMDHAESWNASQAVRESVLLMRGWKMELFKLDLSFLGWYLLQMLLIVVVEALFMIPTVLAAIQGGSVESVMTLAAGTTAGAIVSTLVCMPLDLWLLPYRGLSWAGFYDARQALPPTPPPVYTYDSRA